VEYVLEVTVRTRERHGVDVLPIIRERHKRLAKANGVLARCDAIINLEFFLRDALRGNRNAVRKEWESGTGNVPFEGNTFRGR
jgi:hypothetical protein